MAGYKMSWGRTLLITLAAIILGALTALGPANPSGLELLITPFVLASFFAIFVLVELVPGWRREPSLLNRRMILTISAGVLMLSALYLLLGERELERLLGTGSRPWVFLAFVFLFILSMMLLKRVLASRRKG
jgi:hypothetical protein